MVKQSSQSPKHIRNRCIFIRVMKVMMKKGGERMKKQKKGGSNLISSAYTIQQKEVVPRFDSDTYNYLGLKYERAPLDVRKVIVDKSVKVIQYCAFEDCEDMEVCEMHDGIEEIGPYAFSGCSNLKRIKLSKNLEWIGPTAFAACYSLHAIFIPPSVEEISRYAFCQCRNVRVLSLPQNITPQQIGIRAFLNCCRVYHDSTTQFLQDAQRYSAMNQYYDDNIDPFIIDHCLGHNQPPLHQACLDTEVSAKVIKDCIQTHRSHVAHAIDDNGMVPLHILTLNPYADSGSLVACFEANMNAVFENDNENNTPLDYLREYNVEGFLCLILELCRYRDAHLKSITGGPGQVADVSTLRNTESGSTKKRKFGNLKC